MLVRQHFNLGGIYEAVIIFKIESWVRGLEGLKGWENTLIALSLAVVTSLLDHLCTLAQYCLLHDPSLRLGKCIPFLFVVVRLWMVCTVPHLILWRNLIDMNAPELVYVYKRKKKRNLKKLNTNPFVFYDHCAMTTVFVNSK